MPVPALAEMQVALEQAVGEVTGLSGFELKRVTRTGTVASVDNRNWEPGDHVATIRRLSQRAIALDMESAAVAANGFRFRVPLQLDPSAYFNQCARGYLEPVDGMRGIARHERE